MDTPCKTIFRRRPDNLSMGPRWVQNVSAIFLGAIFAAATASVANAAIPAGERTVLLNFYNATNGDMWGNKTGWLGAPGTECSWHGVTCDAGENHVTNLNMVGNHLHGRLPDLSPLTELQALGLNDNLLSGNIPSLVSLHHLQTLWLARNLLSGPVPPLNASLTDIDVSSNALSGSIPPLSAAPMLAYAYFDENLLTGTIPDLSSLSNLIVFSVDGNLLTGPIPSLAGLNALGDLAVARNNLSGSIPSIAGLPALVSFDVSNNQLTGVLPANYPSGLQAFYANSNSLSGTMPSLASTQLHVFRIEGNAQLNGQVGAAPTPNSLVSGVSGLCPSGLAASGNNQLNSVWSVATGHTPWDYNNTCAQQNANVFRPSVNLSFSPSNIVIGGAGSQMTISMSNPNAQAITGIAFTDSYPAGIANASLNPILQNSCGGVLTAAAGSASATLSGASIQPHGSCVIAIGIAGGQAGVWSNATGPVTSANAPTNQTPRGALLEVVAVDNPPAAQDDQITVAAFGSTNAIVGDQRIPSGVLDNDTDPDHGDYVAAATLLTNPVCGTLTLNNDGTFTYQSTTDQCSVDSFQYYACDTYTSCSQGTAHIAITGANTNWPPIAIDDAIQVAPGATATDLVGGASSILDNDWDPNVGQVLSIDTPGTYPSLYGTYTLNSNGTFSYQNTNLNGHFDEFQYWVCDDALPLPECSFATVHITISDVPNHLPIAVDDAAHVPGGGTTTVLDGGANSVLTNDDDSDPGQKATLIALQIPNGGPGHGTLTLNNDGTFSYHNTDANVSTDSFTYAVRDVFGATSTATVTIALTDVPDQIPVANDDALQVPVGGSATILTGGASSVLANDTDPDPGETATLTAHLIGGQPAHGQLTLNADGTFSYQHNGDLATTDSFTYEARDIHGAGSSATVTITIGNGPLNLPPINVDDAMQVVPGGTTAVLVDGSTSVLTNDFDPNPGETATLTAQLVGAGPTHGTLTFHANDGSFTYHAFGGPPTTDSFQYKACDVHNACALVPATVTITIGNGPINNLPIAIDDAIQVATGGTATLLVGGADSVLANDSDPDAGETATLTAKLISGSPAHGTLTFNSDGTFSYHHNGDAATTDTFVYEARDAHGGASSAIVKIAIGNGPVNHLPFAVDDAIDVTPGGTSTKLVGGAISALANDVDPDPGETAVLVAKSIGAGPGHGTLTFNGDGTFSYQNFMGDPSPTDFFEYEACDIHGACAKGLVTITIGNSLANHLPVAVDDEIQVAPSGTATVLIGGATSVLANDVDPDLGETATLSAVKISDLIKGSGVITLNPDGIFSYHNQNPAISSDSFLYEACDIHGACRAGTVTVTITNAQMNHPPVASDDAIQVAPGGTATTLVGGSSSVLGNDSDPDPGDGLILVAHLLSTPAHGIVTMFTLDGAFSYHNNLNDPATMDSFVYEACDIHGACAAATVTITIGNQPINTPPVAVNDLIDVASGGVATSLFGGANTVLANDTDADGDPLVAEMVTGPNHGTLTFNANGTFSYHNNGDASSNDSFSYRARDTHLAYSNVAIVQITVSGSPDNNPPDAINDAIQVAPNGIATTLVGGGDSVLDNDSDPDGDTLSAAVMTGPTQGTLTLNTDGTFSYQNTNANAISDSFQYRACDDVTPPQCASATVSITIAGGGLPNNAPAAVGDAIQVALSGTATTLVGGANSVLANDTDPDGDPLHAALVSGPTHGTLVLDPQGTFSYHNTTNVATDSFVYQACDSGAPMLCAQATVTISIGSGPTNHLPFPVDDAIDVSAGGNVDSLVGGAQSVLANDIDPDAGDTLHASLLSGPTHGILTFANSGDGTFSYTNANDGAPTDGFVYQACDNHGACAAGVVSITVGGAQTNHLPIVVDDAVQVAPNGTTSVLIGGADSVLGNDSDPDPGETATLAATKISGLLANSGSLTFGNDGTFTYQNTDTSVTHDSFLYEACDVHGACTGGIVTLSITNQTDQLPTTADDAIAVAPTGIAVDLVGDANVIDSVLDNDTDDIGDTLRAQLISAPTNGHVTLNDDGTFVYVNDFPIDDDFMYEACDDFGACVPAMVSITINQAAPVVSCLLPRQVNEVGDTVSIDLALLFTPPPGQSSLSYSATGLPPSLSVVGSLLSGILQANDVPGSPYASTLTATTSAGGASASENVMFQVLPAGEILLRNGFEDAAQHPPCQ